MAVLGYRYMSSDKVFPSNTRSISSDTSDVPRASLLELDIFWIKHGWKNAAMLHCFLQGGSPIVLHSGPAGQLEFESNRLAIYNTKAKIFRSFLRQAHNQITIRYKRQALHNNNSLAGLLQMFDTAAARLHARVCIRNN